MSFKLPAFPSFTAYLAYVCRLFYILAWGQLLTGTTDFSKLSKSSWKLCVWYQHYSKPEVNKDAHLLTVNTLHSVIRNCPTLPAWEAK
jgi:hypothetical protein